MKWTSEEVAYWLTTIGMGKYLTPFVEQFVDGQILLHDITTNNLVHDLKVKSLHSPKIMRELDKLKSVAIDFEAEPAILLELSEIVTSVHIDAFEAESVHKLETANGLLAEMEAKYKDIQSEFELYKSTANLTPSGTATSKEHEVHEHGPSQMSVYSEGPRMDSLSTLTMTTMTKPPTTTSGGLLTADFTVNMVQIDSEMESVIDSKMKEMEQIESSYKAQIRDLEDSVRDARSERLSAENESTEKVLELQRELNRSAETNLKSQQDIVRLNAVVNEGKEAMAQIHDVHSKAIAKWEEKLADYEAMKCTFDAVEDELKESRRAEAALEVQLENLKQTKQLQIDAMERQFKRETSALEEAMSRLQAVNEEVSAENQRMKSQQATFEQVQSLKIL